jgi:regulator of protease activity HflC (stomatin/prohibitin superfamily)
MKSQRGEIDITFVLALAVGAFLLFGGVGGCMWGYPKYKVYSYEMDGRAVLAQAESSRQVAVREALALKDSAKYKAEAEVIRANGVAEANKIIANGLGGPEGYLRYLAIEAMNEQAKSGHATIVYVPTEANIPITEASRLNKPETEESEK